MKKLLSFITVFAIILCSFNAVFAQDEYSFDLQYTGTVVKNQEKSANVLLVGKSAPVHTNVRIKVDITGPATPKILATDSLGNELDIAQLGYWGPDAGFTVGGDFTNTTPIKATFTEEGSYTITLSLIDVANGNAVITSKGFNIEVFEDTAGGNTVGGNNIVMDNAISNVLGNNMTNNTIQELPQTGTSVIDYAMYVMSLTIVLAIVGIYLNRRKVNS